MLDGSDGSSTRALAATVADVSSSPEIFSGVAPSPPANNYEALYLRTLREHFGHDSFRPAQVELINDLMQRKDVLAIIGTDGGTAHAPGRTWALR